MLRIITQQLQPAYHHLRISIHGLPSSIQEAVSRATRHIHKLHSSFSRAVSFQDLSRTSLARSHNRVAEAWKSLDVLFEYVTHNIPLNWIVGPFRAMAKVAQDSRKHKKEMRSDRTLPKLEMAPLSQEVKKAPEEPKGTNRLSEKWCEVLEKLEEKAGKPEEQARKDTEMALAAKQIKTSTPKENL